jgi:hypothetical protein
MKMKQTILLLAVALLGTGCLKSSTTSTPIPQPSGTFTGQFRALHRKFDQVKFDTTKAAIQIVFSGSNFTVTGDTIAAHAGSNGTFQVDGVFAGFTDKTYPTTGTPAKYHLHGVYQYYYDGVVFQALRGTQGDTLRLEYDLTRKTN